MNNFFRFFIELIFFIFDFETYFRTLNNKDPMLFVIFIISPRLNTFIEIFLRKETLLFALLILPKKFFFYLLRTYLDSIWCPELIILSWSIFSHPHKSIMFMIFVLTNNCMCIILLFSKTSKHVKFMITVILDSIPHY